VDVHARAVAEAPLLRLWRAGDDVVIDEISLDAAGCRLTSRRTVVRDGTTRECRWSLRLPNLTEYERWLREAGFDRVRFLAEDGTDAHWSRRRVLVLAHTPDAPAPAGAAADTSDRPRPAGFTGCTR
jgi:hypothetical protein